MVSNYHSQKIENIEHQPSALKEKVLLMPIVKTDCGKETCPPARKLTATGNLFHCNGTGINPYWFNIVQLNDSLGKPAVCLTETGTKELDEKMLKCHESSCCICPLSSDNAPIYAVEIAKLWLQQNCQNAAVPLGHKTTSDSICGKQRNEQQMKDVGVMTSGEQVAQCQQKSGNNAAPSLVHKTISYSISVKQRNGQQMKNTGVMTSGEKVTQCQEKWGDNAAVSLGHKTISGNINFEQRNEQQVKDIGVMTSGEQVLQCQKQSGINAAVSVGCKTITDRINVKQRNEQHMTDIGVMTSGEEVNQCQHKSFTISHRTIDIDGHADNRMLPLFEQVAKFSNTDQMLKSRGLIQTFQKNSGSHKENMNSLEPASLELQEQDMFIVKETKIDSNTTNRQNEIVGSQKMGNRCPCICRSFRGSGPRNFDRTVNKHSFTENNSSDNKCSMTNEATLFTRERTERMCVKSHPVISNVIHTLPMDASIKRSSSRLLIREGALVHKTPDKRKLYLSETQCEVNSQNTARMSGNCGIILTKTTSAEHLHPGSESKRRHQIPCGDGQQTNKICVHLEKNITNKKVKKPNYSPHTEFYVNRTSDAHCNRGSEYINSGGKMNILVSQGNSLAFSKMDQHFTYNMEAQNVEPWLQETAEKMENNDYDAKLSMKSYKIIDATGKLKGGYLENECLGDANLYGQRGISKIIRKNNSLQLEKQNQMSIEGITVNDKKMAFSNLSTMQQNTRQFTKKRSMWSFFRNLLRTLDSKIQQNTECSRKREKQSMYKLSPTSLTFGYKILNKNLESERIPDGTYGLQEKHLTTNTLGHHRTITKDEKRQRHNYTPESNTSSDNMPHNLTKTDLKETIENNYKKHCLTSLAHQDVCCAFRGSLEHTNSFKHFDKTKPLIVDNKQLKFNQSTTPSKEIRSQTNYYSRSKPNNDVHSKKSKYHDQSDAHTNRQQTADVLRDCEYDKGALNKNVIPFLFRDETSQATADEDKKNIVVMVASVNSSSAVANQDIMKELRKQRQEINSLKKMLDKKKKKAHNTSCSSNTGKGKKQQTSSITSDGGMSIMPDFIKQKLNCRTFSDTQNAFGIVEQSTS